VPRWNPGSDHQAFDWRGQDHFCFGLRLLFFAAQQSYLSLPQFSDETSTREFAHSYFLRVWLFVLELFMSCPAPPLSANPLGQTPQVCIASQPGLLEVTIVLEAEAPFPLSRRTWSSFIQNAVNA
jgi:hypothetical protein